MGAETYCHEQRRAELEGVCVLRMEGESNEQIAS